MNIYDKIRHKSPILFNKFIQQENNMQYFNNKPINENGVQHFETAKNISVLDKSRGTLYKMFLSYFNESGKKKWSSLV